VTEEEAMVDREGIRSRGGARVGAFLAAALLLALAACADDDGADGADGTDNEGADGTQTEPEAEEEAVFEGEEITIVVGFSPGGGYDTYARVLGEHIGKHIPGNPSVAIDNMPGAGSLVAANHLFNAAPDDGTSFGTFGRNVPQQDLLDHPEADFDANAFQWVGSFDAVTPACMIRSDHEVETIEDLTETPAYFGTTGPGSDTDVHARLLNEVLGTQIELVPGFEGTADLSLATEQGEIDGLCGNSIEALMANQPHWVEDGFINVLVQMATEPAGNMPEELGDVPVVMDLVDDESHTQLLNVALAPNVLGRPFAAPPDVPEDRIEILRQAFVDTGNDPDFLAAMEEQNLVAEPVRSGQEVQDIVAGMFEAPDDVLQIFAELTQE
jgi:tripartite-type tricarboxylate transporter receptor subunit TctC